MTAAAAVRAALAAATAVTAVTAAAAQPISGRHEKQVAMHANTSVCIMKHSYSGQEQAVADWLVIGCSVGPSAGGQVELKVLLLSLHGVLASLVVRGQRSPERREGQGLGNKGQEGASPFKGGQGHLGMAKGPLHIASHEDGICDDVFFSSELQFYYLPAL